MATALAYEQFDGVPDADCDARIRAAKEKLGARAVILAHHYQRDEVFRHADFSGDSLKLSRLAASSKADYIVFCGVHFMAEVADILSRPDQVSILPDLAAGCSMADMANYAAVRRAWKELAEISDPDARVTPVTYINSSAALKAFCGDHGGLVCTSTNARHVLEWAYKQREQVLFFPDQHLGRNTAYRMGMPLEDMAEWDYSRPLGGLTPAQIKRAKILLWKGFCSVHQMFRPEHIDAFRQHHPEGKVISHPECSFEVCQKSDHVGSTEYIIRTVAESPAGSRWLVGTEINLVNRLQQRFQDEDKIVQFMSPMACMCSTMFRIDPQHLLWTLENLVAGRVVNRIKVPAAEAESARVALNRMLDVSP
ncbi:MAG: quinolinate synthetase [Candidatus Muproteobacteria bacterium RIFCSPHIGHO2_02_FULL_65_16]|uniref:Quinolinate synthase n=1 Tax=Candidatus Muproteobacteria bacterium RIFCSPHIGHO2_02_FULL_65_16 TaxID=1817766 RepID=A0A1F6TUM7_9PROT|nr:MAG: quinolinate synthetase [Candidatus Muproteobacteria bacterium RIFCSPHIGHO2_02_FULL_65_16]